MTARQADRLSMLFWLVVTLFFVWKGVRGS